MHMRVRYFCLTFFSSSSPSITSEHSRRKQVEKRQTAKKAKQWGRCPQTQRGRKVRGVKSRTSTVSQVKRLHREMYPYLSSCKDTVLSSTIHCPCFLRQSFLLVSPFLHTLFSNYAEFTLLSKHTACESTTPLKCWCRAPSWDECPFPTHPQRKFPRVLMD